MLQIIILILGASFALYTVLGGADFGAGVVETFAGKNEERTISKALAPVWEANHVWLILAVVILFTGFPAVYASLSLVLHIPLAIALLGIIFRGCAFTFRHYDIAQDTPHRYYTILFRSSSFITPAFLGITLGAMILGRITFDPSAGFYRKFMGPWLNTFCMTMGLFSVSLFAYISAVFLVGEAQSNPERIRYARFSKRFQLSTLILGLLVFVAAQKEGHPLFGEFIQSPISVTAFLITLLLCPFIWVFLNRERNKTLHLRIAIGLQVIAILTGWFWIQYPILIRVQDGPHLSFFNTQAPPATLQQLLIALIVGLILVIPGFIYLFRVFKVRG